MRQVLKDISIVFHLLLAQIAMAQSDVLDFKVGEEVMTYNRGIVERGRITGLRPKGVASVQYHPDAQICRDKACRGVCSNCEIGSNKHCLVAIKTDLYKTSADACVVHEGTKFCLGDKVISNRGDVGTITAVKPNPERSRQLMVDYKGDCAGLSCSQEVSNLIKLTPEGQLKPSSSKKEVGN